MANYKITAEDPDLKTFERLVAEFNPEFRALRVDGKPSYEHPEFYSRSVEFECLPGHEAPYCLDMINRFLIEDVYEYYDQCQELIERPYSQLVKTGKGERYVALTMDKIMNREEFVHPEDGRVTTGSKEFMSLIKHTYGLWHNWIHTLLWSKLYSQQAWFTSEQLEEVVLGVSYVTEKLRELAKLNFMNVGEFKYLRENQKFGLLAKAFIQIYHAGLHRYIEEYVTAFNQFLVKEMAGNYKGQIKIESKLYVDLVLFYELSQASANLEQEYFGKDKSRSIELQSPSTFMYLKLHQGSSADQIKRNYRWLYIKAWLYSWLKDKDVSAAKAATVVAERDEFYYLKEKVSVEESGDENSKETQQQKVARRKKALSTQFSKWNKYSGEAGFITEVIDKKDFKPKGRRKKKTQTSD